MVTRYGVKEASGAYDLFAKVSTKRGVAVLARRKHKLNLPHAWFGDLVLLLLAGCDAEGRFGRNKEVGSRRVSICDAFVVWLLSECLS